MSNVSGTDVGRCMPDTNYYYISNYDPSFTYGSSTLSTVSSEYTLDDPADVSYFNTMPDVSRAIPFKKCNDKCFGCNGSNKYQCTACFNGETIVPNDQSL
jgi:hypothetical protein